MITLYVTSPTRGSGKTSVCAGLGRRFQSDGKQVGFLKPVTADGDGAEVDAVVLKGALSLAEPVDLLSPRMGEAGDWSQAVKDALSRVSGDKDIVLVEGGDERGQASYEMVKALEARVLLVDDRASETPGDGLLAAQKYFGRYLLGTILNKVPRSRAERMSGRVLPAYSQAGIDVIGVLPEDRRLLTLTISELAERIQASFLNNAEIAGDLAESFMLGAMCVDSGRTYFGLRENKVAVLKSQRPDLQLAALQTPTRCLVLSGDRPPLPQILHQAEDREVPIIQTSQDVPTVVSNMEAALSHSRLSEAKLPGLTGLLDKHIDYPALYRRLGLDGS